MPHLSYPLRSPKAKKSSLRIYFSYWNVHARRTVRLRLPSSLLSIRVHTSQWNTTTQRLKGTRGKQINDYLEQIDARVRTEWPDHVTDNQEELIRWLTVVFTQQEPNAPVSQVYLLAAIEDFIQRKENILAHNTLRKYQALVTILREFNPYIYLNQVNYTLLEDFQQHLLTKPILRAGETEIGLKNSSIQSIFKNLKAVLSDPRINQLLPDQSYMSFKPVAMRIGAQIALPYTDILKLETARLSGSIAEARDLFLILFYTGQRWESLAYVKKKYFTGFGWEYHSEKKHKDLVIPRAPFTEHAFEIIERYQYRLPKMERRYFDRQIKLAFQQAGVTDTVRIDEWIGNKRVEKERAKYSLIGAHTARRSTATYLEDHRVPQSIIQAILGHSKPTQTSQYQKVDRNRMAEELGKVVVSRLRKAE